MQTQKQKATHIEIGDPMAQPQMSSLRFAQVFAILTTPLIIILIFTMLSLTQMNQCDVEKPQQIDSVHQIPLAKVSIPVPEAETEPKLQQKQLYYWFVIYQKKPVNPAPETPFYMEVDSSSEENNAPKASIPESDEQYKYLTIDPQSDEETQPIFDPETPLDVGKLIEKLYMDSKEDLSSEEEDSPYMTSEEDDVTDEDLDLDLDGIDDLQEFPVAAAPPAVYLQPFHSIDSVLGRKKRSLTQTRSRIVRRSDPKALRGAAASAGKRK